MPSRRFVHTGVLCVVAIVQGAFAQSPAIPPFLPPGGFDQRTEASDAAARFMPRWAHKSDYWREDDAGFATPSFAFPLPPLPMLFSPYPAVEPSTAQSQGSAISLDPYWWKGVYNTNRSVWEVYTTETDLYPQQPPGSGQRNDNWHNLFQGVSVGAFPPGWPMGAPGVGGYSDWVDLYAHCLSRAFFVTYAGGESATNWHLSTPGYAHFGFPRVGAPQHVDLPFNYPPISAAASSSTSALVPASGADPAGHYAERETLMGRLDLITGEPLLTETDLELEFGGAVFRRVRSYAERPDLGIKTDGHINTSWDIESWTRGWHGAGWMSSEAPLFLFDASQAGTIATGQADDITRICYFAIDAHRSIPFVQQLRANGEPPDYVAPQWLDAMLLYDKDSCVWGPLDASDPGGPQGWIDPPDEVKVYLQNRSVVYTIRIVYEDVDPMHHERPSVDGGVANWEQGNRYGVPYYGLTTRIEDKAGNRVEITHVDPEKHKPYWDPKQRAWTEDPNSGYEPSSMWVRQRGWYKGMIDHVKLYPAGADVADWSIYYTYRTFFSVRDRDESLYTPDDGGQQGQDKDDPSDFVDYFDYRSHAPALHSMLVYDRDVDASEIASGRELILPCDSTTFGPAEHVAPGGRPASFVDLLVERASSDSDGDGVDDIRQVIGRPAVGTQANQFDHQDIAIGPTGEGDGLESVLPPDWAHQLRFSYKDPEPFRSRATGESNPLYKPYEDFALRSCGPVDIEDTVHFNRYDIADQYRNDLAAYLLKAARRSRVFEDAGSVQELPPRFWLYRYQDVEGASDDAPDPYPQYSNGAVNYWAYGNPATTPRRRLSHRYGPDTIDRIYANRSPESESCDFNAFVNGMIGIDEDRFLVGRVCGVRAPDPGSGPSGELGGPPDHYGLQDGPFGLDGPQPGSIVTGSSTHTIDAVDSNLLPVGLLADTIYYRWSEPYRLDPRLLQGRPELQGDDPALIARPASWALFDGRIDALAPQGAFSTSLREDYVGAAVSAACESGLGVEIAQANLETTGHLPGGAGVFSGVGGDGRVKWYRTYRFITGPETPADWKGSRYSAEGSPGTVYPGPEVIWEQVPEDAALPPGDLPSDLPSDATATHALFYYPYFFTATNWGVSDSFDGKPTNLERDKPMWWTVVDEYNSLEDALSVNSSLAFPEEFLPNLEYDLFADDERPWLNRRVVGMNNAGVVLSDRTWANHVGIASTDDPPAVLEAWAYDTHMRPLYHFTRGWGAAAAGADPSFGDETQEGLVYRYDYEDAFSVDMGPPAHGLDPTIITLAPRTPIATWIRKGCMGIDIPISEIEYYATDPGGSGPVPKEWLTKQPRRQTQYDLSGNVLSRIQHFVGYWDDSELGDGGAVVSDPVQNAQPMKRWDVRAGSAFRRSPAGAQVRQIEGVWYNQKGLPVWRVRGSMADPEPGADGFIRVGASDEVFLDYYAYDEFGRQILAIQDIALEENQSGYDVSRLVFPGHPSDGGPGAPPAAWTQHANPSGTLFIGGDVPGDDLTEAQLSDIGSGIVGDLSTFLGGSAFRRAEAEPLNEVTFRAFNNFGRFKVVYPNGTRDLVHYQLESGYLRQLRAIGIDYDSIEGTWGIAGQNLFNGTFEGQAFTEGILATIAELEGGQWSGSPYDMDSDVFASNRLEVVSTVTPNYDTAGRLIGMTVSDAAMTAEPLSSTVSYDGWGNPLVEIGPDGLITRHRYDGLGRLHKTFVGSTDRSEAWRTAESGADDPTQDDMILTEKVYYGVSPNSASLPVTRWTYRERSGTQYSEDADWFEPSDDSSGGGPAFVSGSSDPGNSSPGRIERYGYDWRMRKVSTEYLDFQQGQQSVHREERMFLDNAGRVRFTAIYAPSATAAAPDPDIQPGSTLPGPSAFLGAGAGDHLVSLEETIYNDAGQAVERRRYDPSGSGGYLATHAYTDHANRAVWSSSSGGLITRTVYDAKGRLVRTSEFAGGGPGAIELTRSVNTFGPKNGVEIVRVYERTDTTGASTADLLSEPHRLTVSYTWYDDAGRVISTADMGSASFDGSAYDRTIPPRPDGSPEVLATISDYLGDTDETKRRVLVGVDYPASFFDPTSGQPLARVSCYWHDRLGKRNAALTVLGASMDPGTLDISVSYVIERTEHNGYGQKVLEHVYEYTGTGHSYTQDDFTLISGTEYGFSIDPPPNSPPGVGSIATTRVSTITPLDTDPSKMAIAWEGGPVGSGGEPAAGRFVAIWAEPSDRRTTFIEYGAPVIGPNFDLPPEVLNPPTQIQWPIWHNDWAPLGMSIRPDLVKAVHHPNPYNGVTGDGLGYSMFYFYYADGLPAIRVDSRGIAIRYVYDADGNLTRLDSNDANMPLVSDLGMIDDQLPSNAIEYAYDALGRLTEVTTGRDYADGTFRADTRSELVYDALGNLLGEEQQRFEADGVTSIDGTVAYAWDIRLRSPTVGATADPMPIDHSNNINRLRSITYPQRVGTHDQSPHTPRVVTLEYGDAGGVSDTIGRVTGLTNSGGPSGSPLAHIATYRYDGVRRLAGIDLGDVPGGAGQFAQSDTREFDLWGRVSRRGVAAFDTQSGVMVPLHESRFGYDLRGQRLFERLAQRDLAAPGDRDNTHSSAFAYDASGRLISESRGSLFADVFAGVDHGSTPGVPTRRSYGLDHLGRRAGAGAGAGPAAGLSVWQDADGDGVEDPGEVAVSTHALDERGGLTGIGDGVSVDPVGLDDAGAITEIAGRSVYHDWLGRPVLVVESGSGAPVFAVRYDGFGRLAARHAPWPGPNPDLQRIETYFYDGVRRIQEVFDDPRRAMPPWPAPIGLPGRAGERRTEAEYIWSAAGGQPFDTCHVQIGWWDREAWFVQDHRSGTHTIGLARGQRPAGMAQGLRKARHAASESDQRPMGRRGRRGDVRRQQPRDRWVYRRCAEVRRVRDSGRDRGGV